MKCRKGKSNSGPIPRVEVCRGVERDENESLQCNQEMQEESEKWLV